MYLTKKKLERRKLQQTNPAKAIEQRVKIKLWEVQHEILDAVAKYNKVAIYGCVTSGKTFALGQYVPNYLEAYRPSGVISTAPSNRQVEGLLWAEINDAYKMAEKNEDPYIGRCLNTEIKIKPKHNAIGFASKDRAGSPIIYNFSGFHRRTPLVIVDEAQGVEQITYESLKSVLSSAGAKEVLCGNPDEPNNNKYHKAFNDSRYKRIIVDAFKTPNFTAYDLTLKDFETGTWKDKVTGDYPYPDLLTPDFVEDAFKDWGIESPLFTSKIRARFPDTTIGGLISYNWIIDAQQRKAFKDAKDSQWGLDVARHGSDRSILYYRRGSYHYKPWIFNHIDTVELYEWSRGIIDGIDPKAIICIDSVGIGVGVHDNFLHAGYNVYEYSGSRKPNLENVELHGKDVENAVKFKNERAEFYWHLRNKFKNEEMAGYIDDEALEELSVINYKFLSGRIQINKKEEIKKKLKGKSPDKADGLMLCNAPVALIRAVNEPMV